jgi:hypothetical protein
MRVTRESLVRIAKDTSLERSHNDRTIIAAYLTGSVAGEADPMLGGTTDIDLVFVHVTLQAPPREIIKLTPDFHLDIQHRTKAEFRSPRELRADPSLGYEMYDPMLLWQSEKFFEFVQAGLRAGFEFHSPALVLARCRRLLAAARKGWAELSDVNADKAGASELNEFLNAVRYAADAVAELSGSPLADRRFLVEFPRRAEAAERPDLTEGLFNLLGASQADPATLASWLPQWGADFLAAAQDSRADPTIHAARFNYYEKAIHSLLEGETPLTALWPIIHTWVLASALLNPEQTVHWKSASQHLGLLGNDLVKRISDLDVYLDQIEIRLDEIAVDSGVETSGRAQGHI